MSKFIFHNELFQTKLQSHNTLLDEANATCVSLKHLLTIYTQRILNKFSTLF